MNGKAWQPYELETLREHYATMPMPELLALLPDRTEKSIWSAAKFNNLKRSKELIATYGKAVQTHENVIKHHFKPGLVPWNTGTKGVCGNHPNTKKNQFQKGALPHNTYAENGIITKRTDTNNRTYYWVRIGVAKWQMLHRYMWQHANGEIPNNMIIRFINGNSLDCRLENLEMVPRALHSIMNNLKVSRELAEVINMATKLTSKIKQYEKSN